MLQGVTVPPPVFFRSIEPPSLAKQVKLDECLALLHKEDPSFQIRVEPETSQTLVGGMGELHLEYILDRLFTHYGVTGLVGSIMIAYRCAPESAVELEVVAEHDYQTSGGQRTYAQVKALVTSLDLGV